MLSPDISVVRHGYGLIILKNSESFHKSVKSMASQSDSVDMNSSKKLLVIICLSYKLS